MSGYLVRLTALLLVAYSSYAHAYDPSPPNVTLLDPVSATSQKITQTFVFDRVKSNLHIGDSVGHTANGIFCGNKRPMVVSQSWLSGYESIVKTVASAELRRLGYPEPSTSASSAFDPATTASPDYRIGALVKSVTFEDCGAGTSFEGWIHVEINWALFSEKEQKVVFEKTTEGLSQSPQKIENLGRTALISSFDNFLAAPELLAAISHGTAASTDSTKGTASSVVSQSEGSTVSAGQPSAPSANSQMQLLGTIIKSGGDAQKNQSALRKAVVTIQTSLGSGSGFYIDREGYLLTDYHVVKGVKFAKVKFPNGDKMIAEVIRQDEKNDIALLKSPAIDFEPLPIAQTTPDIGEDVYAIGTPLGILESTMTRGILSADRTDAVTHLHKLQSDVAITNGSSGGPLLDKQGHVIGLTQSRLLTSAGFNFFIPIQDALQALNVVVK